MSGDGHVEGSPPDESWHSYQLSPDECATDAVVLAVAAVTGIEAQELDPLFETIDPDGLDLLFSHAMEHGTHLRVTFTYSGTDVVVTNRYVRVREHN